MDRNERNERRRRLDSNPYEAKYTAEITDGYLTLPMDCLKDLNTKSLILSFSWEEGKICLYTSESYENVRCNLNRLNAMEPKARALKRRIIGCAVEIDINDENRIHIGPEFLTELGLGTTREMIKNGTLSVVILKYSYVIMIISSSLFEELYG